MGLTFVLFGAAIARTPSHFAGHAGEAVLVAEVRWTQVQHERTHALSDLELSQLLARPDLRTTIGIRDRAILDAARARDSGAPRSRG